MCVCTHIQTLAHVCTYIRIHPGTYIDIYFFFFAYLYIHVQHIHAYWYIHMHVYTHHRFFFDFFLSSEILGCFPHTQFCFSFILAWRRRGEHTLLQWNASLIKFSTLFYHLDFCFRYAYTAYKHYFICIVLAVLWEWLLFIKKHYIHTPFILKIWMESKSLIYMSYLNIAFKIN